jgi:hypothetical protein
MKTVGLREHVKHAHGDQGFKPAQLRAGSLQRAEKDAAKAFFNSLYNREPTPSATLATPAMLPTAAAVASPAIVATSAPVGTSARVATPVGIAMLPTPAGIGTVATPAKRPLPPKKGAKVSY